MPLAMVKRLKKLIRYHVIKQLNSTAHSRSVPKLAPALLIAVRLPVPILYPTRKIPARRAQVLFLYKKIPLLFLRNGISESISCKLPDYGYRDKAKFEV